MKENGLTLVVTRHGQPSPDGILVIQGMIDELTDKLSSLEHQVSYIYRLWIFIQTHKAITSSLHSHIQTQEVYLGYHNRQSVFLNLIIIIDQNYIMRLKWVRL